MSSTRSKLVLAGGLGIAMLSLGMLVRPEAMDMADYLRTPAADAPESRWYSLDELAIRIDQLGVPAGSPAGDATGAANIVDLRDRTCFPALKLLREQTTLSNTEAWEDGIGPNKDVVGYPSVVRNTHGRNPDGRYYLFYAIHDPYSGIAAATAEGIEGPWVKVGAKGMQGDSRVLRAPRRPRQTSHFSSPVVLWNEREKLWFMYFHYYTNQWEIGRGHQRTALATSADLAARDWQPWTNADGALITVLPTTPERWMRSQSSYHAIYKLPGEYWLAFMRGVGGEYEGTEWKQDPAMVGLAVSRDGRHWAQLPGNPWIHQHDGRASRAGVYRPQFAALLSDRYFFAWAESDYYDSNRVPITGVSADLRQLQPSPVDFSNWVPEDGAVPIIREGNVLHVFSGARQRAYEMLDTCSDPGQAADQRK